MSSTELIWSSQVVPQGSRLECSMILLRRSATQPGMMASATENVAYRRRCLEMLFELMLLTERFDREVVMSVPFFDSRRGFVEVSERFFWLNICVLLINIARCGDVN